MNKHCLHYQQSLKRIKNRDDLEILDELRDAHICGRSLAVYRETRFAHEGAHDPTSTFYFVLEDLFSKMDFDDRSHLLDVGCGAGRTLAFFAQSNYPGKATGIELDPLLADACKEWSCAHSNIRVINGNATSIPLGAYSHFYLFNPFDSHILRRFVENIKDQARRTITLCHMSDNGDNYLFMGRPGWSIQYEGEFFKANGVPVYGCPQHYSIWSFDPKLA